MCKIYQRINKESLERVNQFSYFPGCKVHTKECISYENREMKPDEIVLRRKGGVRRENNRGGKSKTHCKHIYKYHNYITIIC
jgi:hypothetical protein